MEPIPWSVFKHRGNGSRGQARHAWACQARRGARGGAPFFLYRNKIRDAISAASTTGEGNRKKNAVNNPVAATTNDSAGGLRSNASAGASNYMILMLRM